MSAENLPVLLTGPMCMAMPVGTAVELAEPRHGVWHAKTSELTWAFFWRTRPTPEQIWQAVEERHNNLSPYPSGLAFVYEPPAKPEATPAPLDPALVQAGDTVTLNIDPSPMEVPYRPYSVRGEVYPIGESLFAGGWPIIGHPSVTLTDHQPAPEPEPAWKPGTVAVVVQGGDPGAGVDDHEFRAALQTDGTWVGLAGEAATAAPVSVRPLVVIDPAAVDLDAIVSVVEEVVAGADPRARSIYDVLHAAFAELGIEATR